MNLIKLHVITLCFLLSTLLAGRALGDAGLKLYTMECGTFDVSDMVDLSITGEYDGQQLKMANPCFLVRHPTGDLLWDVGLADSLVDKVEGEVSGVWHAKSKKKLIDQLAELGLTADDVEYLSLSHAHPDHSGNANKFKNSTFIVNELEQKYMFSEKIKSYFGAGYSALESARTVTFREGHDVFGDGSVLIKSMPGHTPGSSVLLIRLNEAGNILLSGDLYVHARGRKLKTMHRYNDEQATIDSREKFEAMVKQEEARVIIQHDKNDFESLPQFPAYLD